MTIVDKIIASIKAALGEDFAVHYHDDPTLNIETGTMDFPCAIVMLLASGNVPNEAGQLKEQVSAAVFFVEPQTGWDMDAVANERIIDRCKRRGFQWLGGLNRDDYITATLTRTERTYNRYDDIITGMGFLVEVTELQGWMDCADGGDFNNDFNNDFNI